MQPHDPRPRLPGGRRDAWNPEAYWLGQTCTYVSMTNWRGHLGKPLTRDQQRQLYQETRQAGLALGLREPDMQGDLSP